MKTKTFFPIILILFLGLSVDGQNWQPFPKNQRSYFKHQVNGKTEVERVQLDSLWIESKQSYMYFILGSFLKDECYLNTPSQIFQLYWSLDGYDNKVDRFVVRGDSLLFTGCTNDMFGEYDTMVFIPSCNKSDTWLSNGITFKCLGTDIRTVFGVSDSVKIFELNTKLSMKTEIILSKTFGLIKFVPFEVFNYKAIDSNDYYELIGFSNETITKGYIQPDFSDYFHLNAGDVLFWKVDAWPTDDTYHKDSIVGVIRSVDSVRYQYLLTNYDSNQNITGVVTASDLYQRTREGVFVANQPGWYGAQTWYSWDSLSYILFLPSAHYLEVENQDTVTTFEYNLTSFSCTPSNCFIGRLADFFGPNIHFSTREGVSEYTKVRASGADYEITISTLIGSKINSVKHGITDFIPTGIHELENGGIKLYPNPITNELTVQIPNSEVIRIDLYDLNGKLVLSSKNSGHIDVSSLKAGVYVIKTEDNKDVVRYQKIVKQ